MIREYGAAVIELFHNELFVGWFVSVLLVLYLIEFILKVILFFLKRRG